MNTADSVWGTFADRRASKIAAAASEHVMEALADEEALTCLELGLLMLDIAIRTGTGSQPRLLGYLKGALGEYLQRTSLQDFSLALLLAYGPDEDEPPLDDDTAALVEEHREHVVSLMAELRARISELPCHGEAAEADDVGDELLGRLDRLVERLQRIDAEMVRREGGDGDG